MLDPQLQHQWAELMRRDSEKIRLDEAALLIARTEYPQLDPAPYLTRLDELAVRLELDSLASPRAGIQAINELLFEREGFTGNEEHYDDPRNSFLNDVLERKKGIPITLSVVYLEVARRRQLPLAGISFPSHFLVKYITSSGDLIIDPFNRGAILSREDCAERLRANFGADAELRPEHLLPASHKQILARMLNNLKGCFFRRNQYQRVLGMIEMALAIEPKSAHDVRDRGMVHFAMRSYQQALADFRAYLDVSPADDPNRANVLQAIHRIRGLLN
jgi:regulator of sirC expression with transglutaminase-like and TPR domain